MQLFSYFGKRRFQLFRFFLSKRRVMSGKKITLFLLPLEGQLGQMSLSRIAKAPVSICGLIIHYL